MTNYVTVVRHEGRHSKVRYQGQDTVVETTSPRMALRNWLNERASVLTPITIYESYTVDNIKEIVCWVQEK